MLSKAAKQIIDQTLKIKPKERVLLVCDQSHRRIAEHLAKEAKQRGAEVDVHFLVESLRPYRRASGPLKRLANVADVVVYFLRDLDEESMFRGDIMKNGAQGLQPGRVLAAPGISEKSISRLAKVDMSIVRDLTKKVIRYLSEAKQVRVTNKAGTDVSFDLRGSKFVAECGNVTLPRSVENFPAGEAFTCPQEETFNGTIVARHINRLTGRMRFDFQKGQLISLCHFKKPRALKRLIDADPALKNIGEFGVGTNPGAWLSHHFIIAEKVLGTVHFGLGDSRHLGETHSAAHVDIIVTKPTVLVNGRYLMKEGNFIFE